MFEESCNNLPSDYKKVYRKTKCIMLNKLISNPDNVPNVFKKYGQTLIIIENLDESITYVNHIDIVNV